MTFFLTFDTIQNTNRNYFDLYFEHDYNQRRKWVVYMEKTDISSAYRRLKSPNIKTRKRALKIIKDVKRNSGKR
ncbi:hypothetical protein CUZ91_0336 [Enterococcus xinjiangensis]|nr:hypothetical protein [Enterococcus lactis]MBL4999283.1 hypothetical protein [Enterococcus lactis]